MRELKFRVWDDFLNDWHATGATTEFMDKCNKGYDFNIVCFGNPERVHIEQYTGLKDKNGKEIYEGDIIKGSWLYGKDKHIVKYEDYGFYPFTITDFDGDPIIRNIDIEIIGNIHENPELMEGEEK